MKMRTVLSWHPATNTSGHCPDAGSGGAWKIWAVRLRLGSYPCVLGRQAPEHYELFGKKEIQERHRHRYEVNNAYP